MEQRALMDVVWGACFKGEAVHLAAVVKSSDNSGHFLFKQRHLDPTPGKCEDAAPFAENAGTCLNHVLSGLLRFSM